jgi:thiamine biosynthesis lipoprotein
VPTPEEIKKSVAKVGYKKYILDTKITLFFSRGRDEVRIGGGQGFAMKKKALLISKGVVAGIVNVSGDINTWETT